ncbi:MAG: hypothetical protein ACKVQU_28960 [Burkholderiales bacterium]
MQLEGAIDHQADAPARNFLKADVLRAVDETARQEDQACLEIVGEIRERNIRVKTQFPVGKIGSTFLAVAIHQLPEDGARHAFDEIVIMPGCP